MPTFNAVEYGVIGDTTIAPKISKNCVAIKDPVPNYPPANVMRYFMNRCEPLAGRTVELSPPT
jgi:hypothetical protein